MGWRFGTQGQANLAQVIIGLGTIGAFVVAIIVAFQSRGAIGHNSQTELRQSEDAQLSTAITAIGSGYEAERIAGLLLLTQNTVNRFTQLRYNGYSPAELYGDYTTALQVLGGYLSSEGGTFLSAHNTSASFGRGYGFPPSPGIPLDVVDAADQIKVLLAMGRTVAALDQGRPALDLSHDELWGQPWKGANFAWIAAYMPGIDLRGSDLSSSRWSRSSDLKGAYLQCAYLRRAVFRGTDLNYANLNGAFVQGADFRGANLKKAALGRVYGVARWPHKVQVTAFPVKDWNQTACLQNSKLWIKHRSHERSRRRR